MKYNFKRRLLYTLLLIANKILISIPYAVALQIGKAVGLLGYIILSKYRRLTKQHLDLALGSLKDKGDINRIAKSVFINIAMSYIEIINLPKLKDKLHDIIDIKGRGIIDNALKEGNGALVVSAHLGNWELIPICFASLGYPSNVVARPIYYEKYEEWISSLRSGMGVNIIYRTDSPKRLLSLLKENELVGIMPDQDIDSIEGVFVDFFGRKTYTPSAPVKIALASKAPIIPMFIIRSGKKHTIFIEEPIRVQKSEDKEEDVLRYTQQWSDVVESYVRRYPEQWVWMHKRWKTQ